MSGFEAMPHMDWPAVAAVLQQPWPRQAAAHDLRWHAAEHALYRRKLPSVRELADRWGWKRGTVHNLLRDQEAWRDPARPWGWSGVGQQLDTGWTPVGQSLDSEDGETPGIGEKLDAGWTPVGQPLDSSWTHARVSSDHPDHPSPNTPHHEPVTPTPSPQGEDTSHAPMPSDAGDPAAPPAPPPALFDRPAEAADPARRRGVAGEPGPDDVATVWGAWREFHPSARGVPNRAAQRVIRGALAESEASDLIALIRWAHLAPHARASFLRGAAYERGESSVGEHLGIESLLAASKREDRLAWAMEWQRAGCPDYRDGSRTGSTAPASEAVEAWEYLVSVAAKGSAPPAADLALPDTHPRGRAIAVCRAQRLWGRLTSTQAAYLRDERAAFLSAYSAYTPSTATEASA